MYGSFADLPAPRISGILLARIEYRLVYNCRHMAYTEDDAREAIRLAEAARKELFYAQDYRSVEKQASLNRLLNKAIDMLMSAVKKTR